MERNQRCTWPCPHLVIYPGTIHTEQIRSRGYRQSFCAKGEKKKKKENHIWQTPAVPSSVSQFTPMALIEYLILPSTSPWLLRFDWRASERVYYRLRDEPFPIWSSKELLVKSLWVYLSHMWGFLQNQYGHFSVWQVNMKYHIIIGKKKNRRVPSDTQYSYLWQSF